MMSNLEIYGTEVLANSHPKMGGFASGLTTRACESIVFKKFLLGFFTVRFHRREAVETGPGTWMS
jgi:hypothetical protein